MQEDNLLTDAVHHLLAGNCTPSTVRAIEHGGSPAAMWAAIEESGFCDALASEDAGGAGLGLGEVFAIVEACGRYALPLPLAQTMVARALLASAAIPAPAGPIALATVPDDATEVLVQYGAFAESVLLQHATGWSLARMDRAQRPVGKPSLGQVKLRLPEDKARELGTGFPQLELRAIEAALFAAQLAGAMDRVLDITLRYAGERVQFGKAIGSFQAVQHQLSLMAQHTAAARMAARMAFSGPSPWPSALLCAVAKSRAGEAAALVAAAAHAVHGAIGITEEFDLQLYTRRLHAWRYAAGSTTYWNSRVGACLLASGSATLLEFVRTDLSVVSA